jgi:5-bromo-4-chloroindolyl phosphate hydrolysis protein
MTNPNITKYNILKGFISTLLSGISFVLLFFLLQLSVIISVFIGVIVFFIVYNFAPTTKNHHHQSGGSSEKHQNIHEKLKIGQEKLRVIEDNSTKINDTNIRQKIRNI